MKMPVIIKTIPMKEARVNRSLNKKKLRNRVSRKLIPVATGITILKLPIAKALNIAREERKIIAKAMITGTLNKKDIQSENFFNS
jgi:hypothetical protein